MDFDSKYIEISQKIASGQTIASLTEIRSSVSHLISICVPPEDIIEGILYHLLLLLPTKNLNLIALAASDIMARLDSSSKAIFHIEAFVAKSMSIIAGKI